MYFFFTELMFLIPYFIHSVVEVRRDTKTISYTGLKLKAYRERTIA